MMSGFNTIDNNTLDTTNIKNLTDEKIFTIVDDLFILLVQDRDLDKNQRYIAHEKFNQLKQIKEELQGKGSFDHDISTIIGQVLGVGGNDFETQREYIQGDNNLKKRYKESIKNNIEITKIVDQEGEIGSLIGDLKLLNTDFSNILSTKQLNTTINNKQGDIYLLGIAYNLYNNASKFNINNGDIFVSLSNQGNIITISSHNISSKGFDQKTKENIMSGMGNIDSQEDNNKEKGQGIYLLELNKTLKSMRGGITIMSEFKGGYDTTIIITIPKQQ